MLIACAALASYRADVRAGQAAPGCSSITVQNIDDCVRLNQIQVLGTHNSYHLAPAPPMLAALGERARDIEYTHRPLVEQLSQLGIRKFELDVFADPKGGHFSTPASFRLVQGLDPVSADLRESGFKVLHTPDVDYWTTCTTLKKCLTTIRDWSRSNPWHVPIMIMLEAKDAPIEDTRGVGLVKPVPIGVAEFRALDAEIRSVFDPGHIITPDVVRGSRATLAEAVAIDGWPRLRAARGKVLFALDNVDQHRADYLQGNPSLQERVLFVSSEPPEPSAAFIKLNEALGEEEERIRRQVKAGFLIRTRADIPTDEAEAA